MVGQQGWWGRSLALVAVLAVAGCSAVDEAVSPTDADGKPSVSASAGAGGGQAADDGTLPGVPGVAQAREELAGLEVTAHGSMSGYSRAKFPHWAEQDSCDTRETVLERDGTDVKRDDECRAVSGKWVSVYDDEAFTDASELDIDHTVPLANAWRSGASTWSQEKRKAFANDLTLPQLLAVSAASNRSKGDQGPDEWQPPSKTYWCTYARSWVSVKATYKLSVTGAEKDMLGEMLDTCTA
ncbi:HNH endonuclease family protein [Streptomyces sp. 378]|uniref:HNH endonuclease family protein n=1 Tax=Streptomyces sp. 378 TaxID=3049412 RepID=UPI0024C3D5DF|nr:HNH endonuclease family protein [Streptomyces sp. 378]MDK1349204.1 HNH endonuclease family protein [Streptomyces sp. 378]